MDAWSGPFQSFFNSQGISFIIIFLWADFSRYPSVSEADTMTLMPMFSLKVLSNTHWNPEILLDFLSRFYIQPRGKILAQNTNTSANILERLLLLLLLCVCVCVYACWWEFVFSADLYAAFSSLLTIVDTYMQNSYQHDKEPNPDQTVCTCSWKSPVFLCKKRF